MGSIEQGAFAFDQVERLGPVEHPTVILTWREGRVVSTWPDYSIVPCIFQSWPDAIDAVLGPPNEHIQVRVRAWSAS